MTKAWRGRLEHICDQVSRAAVVIPTLWGLWLLIPVLTFRERSLLVILVEIISNWSFEITFLFSYLWPVLWAIVIRSRLPSTHSCFTLGVHIAMLWEVWRVFFLRLCFTFLTRCLLDTFVDKNTDRDAQKTLHIKSQVACCFRLRWVSNDWRHVCLNAIQL